MNVFRTYKYNSLEKSDVSFFPVFFFYTGGNCFFASKNLACLHLLKESTIFILVSVLKTCRLKIRKVIILISLTLCERKNIGISYCSQPNKKHYISFKHPLKHGC